MNELLSTDVFPLHCHYEHERNMPCLVISMGQHVAINQFNNYKIERNLF